MMTGADRTRFHTVPVFCVGEKTAKIARDAGFQSVVTGNGDGRALVERVTATLTPPAKLLYLTGTPRKPFIEEGLKQTGFALTVVELYETRAVDHWPGTVEPAVRKCNYALHFSRSSVEHLLKAAEPAGLSAMILGLRHFCLSDDVAEPLRDKGAADLHVASRPTEEDLFDLLHIKET